MQTNVTIMMNIEGNFVSSIINNTGEEQFINTNFEELDKINPEQPWIMMTRTITQYKYNKTGIMNSKIEEILNFVKEELDHTPDISVMCYKPDMTVIFFKE